MRFSIFCLALCGGLSACGGDPVDSSSSPAFVPQPVALKHYKATCDGLFGPVLPDEGGHIAVTSHKVTESFQVEQLVVGMFNGNPPIPITCDSSGPHEFVLWAQDAKQPDPDPPLVSVSGDGGAPPTVADEVDVEVVIDVDPPLQVNAEQWLFVGMRWPASAPPGVAPCLRSCDGKKSGALDHESHASAAPYPWEPSVIGAQDMKILIEGSTTEPAR